MSELAIWMMFGINALWVFVVTTLMYLALKHIDGKNNT